MDRFLVLGDSDMIIKWPRRLRKKSLPSLMWIYQRIRNMEKQFKSMRYFHILRRQNGKEDALARASKQLKQGKIHVNEEYSQTYIS